MLLVISPAKRLDIEPEQITDKYTIPEFLSESEIIIKKLKSFKAVKISKLMGVSSSLGQVNYERFQTWHLPFTTENAKQAIFSFNGDVYQGLVAKTLNENQLDFAQQHLRILSGLYGVLRPLDLIQPYRLEMGTKLSVGRKKDLYQFWKKMITDKISDSVKESGSDYLINLASNEYFKSIETSKLKPTLIIPI